MRALGRKLGSEELNGGLTPDLTVDLLWPSADWKRSISTAAVTIGSDSGRSSRLDPLSLSLLLGDELPDYTRL